MEGAPPERDDWTIDRLSKLLAIASGVAGTVVYIYVLGGLVVWARLTASLLYTDSAINALGSKSLLASGLKVVAFEIGLLGLVGLVVWLVWKPSQDPDGAAVRRRRLLTRVVWLFAEGSLVAFVFACLLACLSIPPIYALVPGVALVNAGLVTERAALFRGDRHWAVAWTLGIAVVVCAVFLSAAAPGVSALFVFALLKSHGWMKRRLRSSRRADLIAPILILITGISLSILAFLATPPVTFDRVIVVEKDKTVVEGGFVARSDDDVFVATCVQEDDPYQSKKPRLQVIPSDAVSRITLGGKRYAMDNGKRPSLFDLGLRLFSQEPVEEHLDGWRPTLRGRLEVCKGTRAP